MTLVRFKNNSPASFNNFLDDFFPARPSLFRNDFGVTGSRQTAPVNIAENEKEYILELVAPGFEKEDFKIDLEQGTLTIAADRKNKEKSAEEKSIRREYHYQSFKRSFTIDEQIDDAHISAKYVNGVLTLNLPKKATVKEAAKQISIQ